MHGGWVYIWLGQSHLYIYVAPRFKTSAYMHLLILSPITHNLPALAAVSIVSQWSLVGGFRQEEQAAWSGDPSKHYVHEPVE